MRKVHQYVNNFRGVTSAVHGHWRNTWLAGPSTCRQFARLYQAKLLTCSGESAADSRFRFTARHHPVRGLFWPSVRLNRDVAMVWEWLTCEHGVARSRFRVYGPDACGYPVRYAAKIARRDAASGSAVLLRDLTVSPDLTSVQSSWHDAQANRETMPCWRECRRKPGPWWLGGNHHARHGWPSSLSERLDPMPGCWSRAWRLGAVVGSLIVRSR